MKQTAIETMLTPEYRLMTIETALNNEVFSKTVASRLVGGKANLMRLVERGKIRIEKPTNKQNGKWFCNAGDVIRNIQIV
jgi:hypothetical protein